MNGFKFYLAPLSLTQKSKCIARHEALLNARDADLKAGKITVSDWAEAKGRIKKNVTGYGSRI